MTAAAHDGWVGDYGDNPLWFYQQYQTSEKATTTAGQQLAVQGAVQPWQPNAGTPLGPNHVNHVLAQFIADCAAGTTPAGVLDRRAVRVLRAPVGQPELRRPLRRGRCSRR